MGYIIIKSHQFTLVVVLVAVRNVWFNAGWKRAAFALQSPLPWALLRRYSRKKRPFLSRSEPFLALWTLNYVTGFSYENLVLNFTRVVVNLTRVVLNCTWVIPRSSSKAGYTVRCTQLSLVHQSRHRKCIHGFVNAFTVFWALDGIRVRS